MSLPGKFKIAILVFLISMGLASCKLANRPEGHFEGTLVLRQGEHTTQEPVKIDITLDQKSTGKLIAQNPLSTVVFQADILSFNTERVQLYIPGFTSGSLLLYRDANCFNSQSPSTPESLLENMKVEFCFDAERFLLEIYTADHLPVLGLSGDRFNEAPPPTPELPRDYQMTEAIQMALNKNFESRIQYEHLIQAKKTASASFLQLLPSFGAYSALSLISPSVLGLLATIGGLAPFLLPTRWFQAVEASHQYHANQLGRILMQADLATEIEGLTYALVRDQGLEKFYLEFAKLISDFNDLIRDLEEKQGMPVGSTEPLQTKLYSIQMDQEALKLMIRGDLAALGHAMGFFNPTAVSNMILDQELLPIERAISLNPDEYRSVVLARSFELAQMDELIRIAEFQRKELYFSWMDPTCDPSRDLGFGLKDMITVSQSKIRELKVQREQLQAVILRELGFAINEYNINLKSYEIAEKNQVILNTRVERMRGQIYFGTSLNPQDLNHLFEDVEANGIRKEAIRASFRGARARLDRLLLQGVYLGLRGAPGSKPNPVL